MISTMCAQAYSQELTNLGQCCVYKVCTSIAADLLWDAPSRNDICQQCFSYCMTVCMFCRKNFNPLTKHVSWCEFIKSIIRCSEGLSGGGCAACEVCLAFPALCLAQTIHDWEYFCAYELNPFVNQWAVSAFSIPPFDTWSHPNTICMSCTHRGPNVFFICRGKSLHSLEICEGVFRLQREGSENRKRVSCLLRCSISSGIAISNRTFWVSVSRTLTDPNCCRQKDRIKKIRNRKCNELSSLSRDMFREGTRQQSVMWTTYCKPNTVMSEFARGVSKRSGLGVQTCSRTAAQSWGAPSSGVGSKVAGFRTVQRLTVTFSLTRLIQPQESMEHDQLTGGLSRGYEHLKELWEKSS